MNPLFWISRTLIMIIFFDRLYSLLQSMLNSRHAYNQNKAFTKHIVDAMMKCFEEKLELEVSIPIKLYHEWDPTIKIKIKYYECYALCDLGASISMVPKTLCVMC